MVGLAPRWRLGAVGDAITWDFWKLFVSFDWRLSDPHESCDERGLGNAWTICAGRWLWPDCHGASTTLDPGTG